MAVAASEDVKERRRQANVEYQRARRKRMKGAAA
jgi:hypothetical protein